MRGKKSDPELAARVVAKVAAWQEEHKVSDTELSRRLSASPVLVYHWKCGDICPSLTMFVRLCRAMKTDPTSLLEFKGET